MRLASLLASGLALGGCVFEPVPLEGRVCATNADCISGYECSTERVCVRAPDAGRPDAARPDVGVPDVGRDAFAPIPDADLDAPLAIDADGDARTSEDAPAAPDASSPDASELDAATADAASEDASASADAPPDDVGVDARTDDAAAHDAP